MNVHDALFVVKAFLGISMALQAVEILLLSRRRQLVSVWSRQSLWRDFQSGLPMPNLFGRVLSSEKALPVLASLQLIAAVTLPWFSLSVCVLFLSHLAICIRFRGTFNGGSDMMTFVVLTGVLATIVFPTDTGIRLSLLYVAIHTLLSYFKGGVVKVRHRDWRSGEALGEFLGRSLYPNIRTLGSLFKTKKTLSLICCWSVIVFELSALVWFFSPSNIVLVFALAMTFHFINFVFFGLNRFFWAWLAAWPAVLYSFSHWG